MAGTSSSPTRRAVLVAAGVAGAAALLVWGLAWWSSPPQMGAEPEVFKTVDALFTAVTARDEKLLGQCAQRLSALKDDGRLPGGAADYLDGIVARARDGRWQSAAERLYGFMRAQRREGAQDHSSRHRVKGRRDQGTK
jgi:hypothetical protein